MNVSSGNLDSVIRQLCRRLWLAFPAALFSLSAQALEVEFKASFLPDPGNPLKNEFTNNTPPSGYCASYPTQCKLSFRLPLTFRSRAPIESHHTDFRQGATLKAPALWRTLTVVNSATGDEAEVEVRISGIGSQYELSQPAMELVPEAGSNVAAHHQLWGMSWVNAPAPCLYSGLGYVSSRTYTFFWKTPVEGFCSKLARYPIPEMEYLYLDVAYELRTPKPLEMDAGIYTGSISYSVGPFKDFDMGDVMLPSDDNIVFNFTLTVEHTLKVEIPPGGNRIQLEPQGGWQAWLNQGRKPARLFRDQTFNLSASSRFKMQLECGTGQIGDTCAVQNAAGDQVPLNVLVSLPNGLTNIDGGAVNRLPLRVSGAGTELFQPSFYVDRRPGTLHFEVQREGV
ncbi:hypothetical protein KW849_11425, partial [Pseudomonas sp. PDM26]|uniref:hypothetical protein n=1 Tax=Pseudomonas sp. PDM26 TaxID=2854766 RepID=UPI001C43DCE5